MQKALGFFQSVKKVEVQEALPPAGGIGAEPLNPCATVSSPQTSEALFAGVGGQRGVFDRLKKPLCFFSPFWFVYDIERFSSCVYDKDA